MPSSAAVARVALLDLLMLLAAKRRLTSPTRRTTRGSHQGEIMGPNKRQSLLHRRRCHHRFHNGLRNWTKAPLTLLPCPLCQSVLLPLLEALRLACLLLLLMHPLKALPLFPSLLPMHPLKALPLSLTLFLIAHLLKALPLFPSLLLMHPLKALPLFPSLPTTLLTAPQCPN